MEYKLIKTTTRSKEGSKYLQKELDRLHKLMQYEDEEYLNGITYIAGIDEAGRGPLAGPVVASAVILPKGLLIEGVNDSKKLSEKKREELFDVIVREAVAWGVGIVDNNIIDEINILNATRLAMRKAVEQLEVKPEVLFIDAESLEDIEVPQKPMVRGDSLSQSIAAASIIAKVTRDRMIIEIDKIHEGYGFARHKGYGTAEHIEAIRRKGLCPLHRRSFTRRFVR